MASQATATANAVVALNDSGGNSIASQPVVVTYVPTGQTTPITTLGTGTTNSAGVATVSAEVPAPGTYDFTATFAGVPGKYSPSTSTQKGVVVAADTVITINVTVA